MKTYRPKTFPIEPLFIFLECNLKFDHKLLVEQGKFLSKYTVCKVKYIIQQKHEVRNTSWKWKEEMRTETKCGRRIDSGVQQRYISQPLKRLYGWNIQHCLHRVRKPWTWQHVYTCSRSLLHTCTHTHTRAGPARLIWVLTSAEPPCREAVAVGRDPDHFGQYH